MCERLVARGRGSESSSGPEHAAPSRRDASSIANRTVSDRELELLLPKAVATATHNSAKRGSFGSNNSADSFSSGPTPFVGSWSLKNRANVSGWSAWEPVGISGKGFPGSIADAQVY